MGERLGLVFDLDNFLLPTQIDYNIAMQKLNELLYRVLGFHVPHIATLNTMINEIEMARAKTMGLHMRRFPGSLAEVYRELCKQHGFRVDAKIERECLAIGFSAFNPAQWVERGLVEGAETVLQNLRDIGAKLILCTKGDPTIQDLKVQALALDSWFKVWPHTRKAKPFGAIADFMEKMGVERRNMWSAGDSYPSDIEPALKAGMRGIFLPSEERNWQKERRATEVDHSRVRIIQNITDIWLLYQEGMLR